uniref:Neur_chan_LBD domain-containing protein n=1 Tax=Panagrellus redivivus TaxID=6233 RepID=A0A7E4UR06_PANRE
MTTIFRLDKPQLEAIAKGLKPEIPDEVLSGYDLHKLRIIISEWLMLNDYSSIHEFRWDNVNQKWENPKNFDCDCCWRYKVGRRRINTPTLKPIPVSQTTVNDITPREKQMLYFGGPWVFAPDEQAKGKPKYRIRSHLLHTTIEKSVYVFKA